MIKYVKQVSGVVVLCQNLIPLTNDVLSVGQQKCQKKTFSGELHSGEKAGFRMLTSDSCLVDVDGPIHGMIRRNGLLNRLHVQNGDDWIGSKRPTGSSSVFCFDNKSGSWPLGFCLSCDVR